MVILLGCLMFGVNQSTAKFATAPWRADRASADKVHKINPNSNQKAPTYNKNGNGHH